MLILLQELSDQDKKDIQITMVLPGQNENGDWLAMVLLAAKHSDTYIEKDKKYLKIKSIL